MIRGFRNSLGRADCSICKESGLEILLNRVDVPVLQNALYSSEDSARNAPRGDLALAQCQNCGFVFNAKFDPNRLMYDQKYENDQSHSPAFVTHMEAMANRILGRLAEGETEIVEVGCGQGGFLAMLHSRAGEARLKLKGLDPTYRGGALPGGISIIPRFLELKTASEEGLQPDIVVSRHVIEHVSDPANFLSAIHAAAKPSVTRLFLETPCFSWIASHGVVQDVFYEHVNYFTGTTLKAALQGANFESVRIDRVFGGQYLWAEAIAGSDSDASKTSRDSVPDQLELASAYTKNVDETVSYWRSQLEDGVKSAIWGAGAKGVTFAGLVDPNRNLIVCLIDSNPAKQGAWIAGTAHPIVSCQEAASLGVKRILIMNGNYLDEIRGQIAAIGWNPVVVVVEGVR